MPVLVCVSPDYPQTVPLVAIELRWDDQPCPFDHVQVSQYCNAQKHVQWCACMLLLQGNEEKRRLVIHFLFKLNSLDEKN